MVVTAASKRTGRVSDPGGLNHRAAGCPAAEDDQTQYVHPFARLGMSPVRLNTATAAQAGREARGADRRRGSVRPSEASPTAEKRELDERSLGTEAVRVLSGTAQRRVKSGWQRWLGISVDTKRLRCKACGRTFSQALRVLAENRMMTDRWAK